MCLRKTSTIDVYIEVVYIYYSVYRSRETLQMAVIEINAVKYITSCQRFVNDFATICYLLTILQRFVIIEYMRYE